MTRDYAKKPRPKPKPILPPWLWMMTGLLIGLFVAFLVYINRFDIGAPQGESKAPATASVAKPRPAPVEKPSPDSTPEKDEKVRFDFYSILPQYEVSIPKEDLEEPVLNKAPPGNYLIQAGSFRTAEDADTRRAQLALLGLVARIETVKVDDNSTWHRVQLGPYEDLKKLDQARKLLQTSSIDFLLLKAKN